MALGSSSLQQINTYISQMASLEADMRDCWNTFQYVTKSLEGWAEETEIGTDVVTNMRKLSDYLQQLLNYTFSDVDSLINVIAEFKQNQEKINQ